jgi:hypothetical protein
LLGKNGDTVHCEAMFGTRSYGFFNKVRQW